MAVDFGTDGNSGDYVIFQVAGKTMIGKFYKNATSEISTTGGTHSILGYENSCYYVMNPAEIEWNLVIPASGSADITWKIKPLYYKDMISSTDTLYHNVAATFPKSMVVLTNIGGSSIDASLLDAYKSLCE